MVYVHPEEIVASAEATNSAISSTSLRGILRQGTNSRKSASISAFGAEENPLTCSEARPSARSPISDQVSRCRHPPSSGSETCRRDLETFWDRRREESGKGGEVASEALCEEFLLEERRGTSMSIE